MEENEINPGKDEIQRHYNTPKLTKFQKRFGTIMEI